MNPEKKDDISLGLGQGAGMSFAVEDAGHPLKGRVICVDGPSASGKGTLAKNLARVFRLKFLDTGCLYRAVGWQLMQEGAAETDVEAAVRVATELAAPGHFDFRHKGNNVFGVWLGGREVTEDIRMLEVGMRANVVAQMMPLRLALRRFQQEFARHWKGVYGVVLDGRDTGSKIAPDADLKLMMTGDPVVRAHWRLKDYLAAGKTVTLEQVVEELRVRDERDARNMEVFPDTVMVDVTATNAAGVLMLVFGVIEKKFGVKPL